MSYKAMFVFALACTLSIIASAQTVTFTEAKPVWPEGRETEMNLTCGFRAVFEVGDGSQPIIFRATASNIYRIYVNGEFAGHGPARACHGYYRVDEWDITASTRPGRNVVAAEVVAYNVNSYYLLDQPGFFQAELIQGEKVFAATGNDQRPFETSIVTDRIQKVQKYSFQRTFIEAYRLQPDSMQWRKDPGVALVSVKCTIQPEKKLLPRRVALPDLQVKAVLRQVSSGTLIPKNDLKADWKDPLLQKVNEEIKGYPEDQLEVRPTEDLQRLENATLVKAEKALDPKSAIELGAMQFACLDLGTNLTGFLGATITCEIPTKVCLAFDELITDNGDVNWPRLGCSSVVTWILPKGTYSVESIEPYTMRSIKAVVLEGKCSLSSVHLREYVNPETTLAKFEASDARLNKIYAAAVQTFRQNAPDVFMDCPSRERAGWLCDSFFTARVAKDVSGNTHVEQNFMENYQLPPSFPPLPEGMLPMCYPSEHYNGVYIPNWSLWFVLQLEEYATRSGDKATVETLRPRVLALLDFFKKFRNSDGLLEKLESWVFVEWSKANDYVQDVNYPSNMLYAESLAATGRMYALPELLKEADAIRKTIRKQSFDGEFFVDNALRKKDGKLEVTKNRTEVCQYFAFQFGIATPKTHHKLWKIICDKFGPDRKDNDPFPKVGIANSFIGNVLRMEILSRYGRCQQILDESIEYLEYMADRSGTLWENTGAYASCNHGFASHAIHSFYRDVLGLYSVDSVNRKLVLRFSDLEMDKCSGTIPTPDGLIELSWQRNGKELVYTLKTPPQWDVSVEKLSKQLKVVAAP